MASSSSTFAAYTSTSFIDPFSKEFFERLTIQEAASLSLPHILPPKSGRVVQFRGEIPKGSAAVFIDPDEAVPHWNDLRALCDSDVVSKEYQKGARSVEVELLVGRSAERKIYHFRKVSTA